MYETPKSKVSRGLVFFSSCFSFLLFITFSSFPSFALAADFPVPSTFTLPEQLPYDDGTTVWNHWIAIKHDTSAWWIIYHNCDNLYWHDTGIRDTTCTDTADFNSLTGFSAGNDGNSWSGPDVGGFNLGSEYFNVPVTNIGYRDVARNYIFADHSIFADHTYTSDCGGHWCDVIPITFGQLAINRVNFNSDGSLIGVSDPGATIIANNTSDLSDYVDVPNPVTDPTGFIGAVFTNFFVFFYKALIPEDNYFYDKITEIETTWSTDQPGLASINTAFADGVVSLSSPSSLSPVTLGALHIGSAETTTVTIFDPASFDSGIFDGSKALISAFMYFGVAFWVIRQVSTIMSA